MEFKIDVNVTAPELVKSINHLAEAISTMNPAGDLVAEPEPTENTEKVDQADTNQPKRSKKPKTKTITLEDVRAKLAALSQDGKQAEVKELITEFGAKKLSDVPAEKYSELLAKAEVL